jgi:hypothetical protein
MRNTLITFLLCFTAINISAQKVQVRVTKVTGLSRSDWQIIDNQNIPVFAGNEYFREDTIYLLLEENKRYFLEVSVSEVNYPDTAIYSLSVSGETVLSVNSDIGPGDHFFPFFTGVRKEVSKITGGTATSIGNYPWQVFLEAGNFTCGGSIISGNWVITAAHCTEDDFGNLIPASQMDIIVGASDPRSGLEGKKYLVSKVIRHENYNPDTFNNDIALLQILGTINYTNATPIRLVSKIDSASGATDPGVMTWVTGYGLTKVSPPVTPLTLQQVQLPIVSNSQASTVWPVVAPSDVMAGYRNGNKDACNGDSGGPMVVPVDNEYKLAGLVSWGSGNCDTYGAYTRISIFESWISSKTGIEISYTPPVPTGDSIVCKGVPTSIYSVAPIVGVTAYEWQLLPVEAGTIEGNSDQASVSWDQAYTGPATVRIRVTRYGFLSYWSPLTVHLAKDNRLLSQSADTIICSGQPVVLTVASEGYNLSYSWFKDNILVKSGPAPELSLSNTQTESSGLYRCDIAGSCGETVSPVTDLTVLPVTGINSITPDTEANFGDNITLDVNAGGHNLIYQWQKDGNQIPDATAPVYALLNVNASNTGLYSVVVSGSCGEVTSKNVYIYITDNPDHADPEIFVWPTLVTGDFNIALSNNQKYDLRLFNSSGSLMLERLNCQFKTTLNMSNSSGGVYILTVSGNKFKKSIKLIKN